MGPREGNTLTRASRGARNRAQVFDSPIPGDQAVPTVCGGGGLTELGGLSLQMCTESHRWLLTSQTSQWEAPRWAGGSSMPSGSRRDTWGQVPACMEK